MRNFYWHKGPFFLDVGRFVDDYTDRMYCYALRIGVGPLSFEFRIF